MAEEKRRGFLARHGHKLALGAEALTVLSIVFLVPFLRRRHEHRHHRRHGHFAPRSR
jgi:hypothetical protein